MKIRFILSFVLIVFAIYTQSFAQGYSGIAQISSSNADTFVRDISGDGRLVVMESSGNIATENPSNSDGNREIFLYDYAQRRIFQITNTKSLLKDTTMGTVFSNIKVEIVNTRPMISNDGRWIAFSSNATTATPATPANTTNPGNFDGNSFTDAMGNNPLTADGNTEIWLYSVPAIAPVDLTLGTELPLTNLAGSAFTRVTNSPPSRLPVPASNSTNAVIGDDNRDVTINDDGNVIAFTSNRDIVAGGNSFPNDDNPEIFTYIRSLGAAGQVTQTPRGTILDPIFNANPSISGNGTRVCFVSNGNNPVVGMTNGANSGTDKNEEIFFSDLDATGNPTGMRKQITATKATNPGDVTNTLSVGRRISRDGRYIAFDSIADLTAATPQPNATAIGTFLYDTTLTTSPFRQIGPRGNSDAGAPEGDVLRFPTFSDYDGSGVPQNLVMATRLNIKPDGTIPTTSSEGLNDIAQRPSQVYTYPLNSTNATGRFTRMGQLPPASFLIASAQPIPSNSSRRIAFSLNATEVGGGNPDLFSEGYYLFVPQTIRRSRANLSFATGASDRPVTQDPVPDPTPNPTPTPSPSPSPVPTPTPITPPAVQGISPGMLASVEITSVVAPPIVPVTVIGSNSRRAPLPLELNGVSMTIANVACGLRSVSGREIKFIAPLGLAGGFVYPMSINLNGVVVSGNIAVVAARPDIFTYDLLLPGPNGRADTFNATNPTRVLTREPFAVRTLKFKTSMTDSAGNITTKGNILVPSVIRVYLTGVYNVTASQIIIRVGNQLVAGPAIRSGAVATDIPGRFYVDFELPDASRLAGDVPIILTVNAGGTGFVSRLDDTAPRIRIL